MNEKLEQKIKDFLKTATAESIIADCKEYGIKVETVGVDCLFELAEKEIQERHQNIEADIEFILRNKIDIPIKGEITISKLRWRGIKDIAYGENFTFLGIMQRGKIITK